MGEKQDNRYRYQYGNTAYDYYEHIPEQTPSRKPVRRKKQIATHKLDLGFAAQIFACGLLVFSSAFIYIHQYAQFSAKQKELGVIKNEIRETKSKISLTEAKISEKLNLDYIRERAANELGMSEPLVHQIVYIELPKESYTVYEH